MSKQREPSFGSLVGMAIVWFFNSITIGIALLVAIAGNWHIQKLFVIEAIFFAIAGILNILSVTVTRKGKLLKPLRAIAILGNAMFLLLATHVIMYYTAIYMKTIILVLLCLCAAMLNIVSIIHAPTVIFQQDMICPECDYDLRGLRSRGCPECGWGRKN